MIINELREIAAASGIQHAEFCLEQHTTQIGRESADPMWLEMARLVEEYADDNDVLSGLADLAI